jgi:hypothetical protein
MITLTPQEMERAKQLRGIGVQPNEIFNQLASERTGFSSPSQFTPVQAVSQGSETMGDVRETFKDIGGSFQKFSQNIGRAATQPGLSLPQRFTGGLAATATLPLDVAGSVVTGVAKGAVSQAVEDRVSGMVSQGVQRTIETPAAQNIMSWYEGLDDSNKYNVSQIMLPIGTAMAEIGTGGALGQAVRGVNRTVPDVSRVVDEAAQGNIAPATRVTNATLDPNTRTAAVDSLTEAYRSSLVENRLSINNKLEDLAKQSSRGGEVVTRDSLIRNLADEGYIPEIEGRLARFDTTFKDIETRQRDLMQQLEPLLAQSKTTIKTDDLLAAIRKDIIENPQVVGGLSRSSAELQRFIEDVRLKYGDELNAQQINTIRKDANANTKAFRDSDKFAADTYSAVGSFTRNWLDEAVPNDLVRRTNAEWARLNALEETARILNNQQVDVGVLGRALGSYVTVVAGSTAGVAVGGPGGLVVAGLLAKIGGDKLADMMRKRMFNDETMKVIRDTMRKDDTLREELLRTMKEQDKKIFQMALPAPKPGAPRSAVYASKPITTGGQTAKGKVEAGITERAKEGAIKQPTQSGFFKNQVTRFKDAESFVKAVRNNPAWLAKLEKAGVTPEEIGKLAFAGTAMMALPLLLDEELSAMGFLVAGSIMGGAPARKVFVDKIVKLSDEKMIDGMTQFTGAYKSGAYKGTDGETMRVVATKNFTKEEAQAALDNALATAEGVPVISNASLRELNNVFEDALSKISI